VAIESLAATLSINHETLRIWVRRTETDSGKRPGLATYIDTQKDTTVPDQADVPGCPQSTAVFRPITDCVAKKQARWRGQCTTSAARARSAN
jgi:transposase-like protein